MEMLDLITSLFPNGADPSLLVEPVECFIGAAITAGAGLLGSAIGAIGSAKANKKNERKLKAMENENRADYLREYYRGALENEGSRAYLKKLDERMKKSDRAAENALAAQGATHENALAAKQANNEIYSDAVANLVENEQARKDAVRAQYKEVNNSIAQQQMQQNAKQAATWSQVGNAITSGVSALGSAGVFDNLGKAAGAAKTATEIGKGNNPSIEDVPNKFRTRE